jgi:HEAT repeat protein
MTGPLLRIVGDRNPSNVKVAILRTLGLILVKGGPALRAFVPQFQTTFVKALSDPSRQVRVEAIEALSLLMPLSTRVDPLIKELVSGSLGKNTATTAAVVEGQAAAAAVQTATLEALAVVLATGGDKAKLPASVPSALDASIELLKGPDEGIRSAAAKVMGVACGLSGPEIVEETVRAVILDPPDNDSSNARHGKACAIRRILCSKAGDDLRPALLGELRKLCVDHLSDDKGLVREAMCIALGAAIGRSPDPRAGFALHQPDLLKILTNPRESMDVHRSVAKGLCLALSMVDRPKRLDAMGVVLVDACLNLTLTGTQRVQFAVNDVLWMALDVESGNDGLERYASIAVFDNVRAMKSLHSKVLVKIKNVQLD